AQPGSHLGEGGRGVHHGLFVPREVIRHRRPEGLERFADAGDVAVTENAEHAGNERPLPSIARRALLRQKPHHRLRHRQADSRWRGHIASSPRALTNAVTSFSVGMKFAQPWRVTTIAPVALPMRAARSSGHPCRYPYRNPLANAS